MTSKTISPAGGQVAWVVKDGSIEIRESDEFAFWLGGGFGGNTGRPRPQLEAELSAILNLAAAAPAMLEALEGLADVLEHDCDCSPCIGSMSPGEHYLGLARAAIALARAGDV